MTFLYVMFFTVLVGLTWGETTLEAGFLKQVGVEYLPWFFIIKALVAIPAMALYTALTDQVANNKLLIGILGVSIVSIAGGLALLGGGQVKLAYLLLYLIVYVPMEDIFFTHWYTYVDGFYDTQSTKRVIPVLGTAGRIAGIIAGLSLPILNSFITPGGIIFIWLGTLITIALLAWLMPYWLKEKKLGSQRVKQTATAKPYLAYLDNLREGYRYVSESSYLRWMALATILLMLLFAALQYQTSQLFLDQLKTQENIANFIGRLTSITNLIILPIQLFWLSRLIGKMGLGNASLIFPGATVTICGSLLLAPSLPTATLAYFNRTNFYAAIGFPIENLLYNAVPLRVKGRARAFIGGLVAPIGALLGGGLLVLLPSISATRFLPLLIGLFACAYLFASWVIRKQYGQALITMLEQEDFSTLLSQSAANLAVTDTATLNWLKKKLEESSSYEFTIFMAKLISQLGGSAAIPILGQAAKTTADTRTRAALIDVLVAADLHSEALRQLYADFLLDPDGQVRQSAIIGLEELSGPQDKKFLELALQMLTDPDTEVRARVLPVLLKSNNPSYQTLTMQTLTDFLHHEDPQQRARGVHVLNQVGDIRFINTLLEYVTDRADEVRLEAAMAIEALSLQKLASSAVSQSAADKLSPLTRDPIERVRQAALVILGRLGNPQLYPILIEALLDPSPQVRTTAVDVLAQVGKAIIPAIHPMLNHANPQLRKMTTVVLSRINRRDFGPLVESHITGNLIIIYSIHSRLAALTAYAKYPTIAVLQSALHEQNQQLIDEIFYLLTAIHEAKAVKIIEESFHSETARVRANAVEALESLTSPQTAGLIAPIFEPQQDSSRLLEISREAWEMLPLSSTQAIEQIINDPHDPWLQAIMIYALGEMGVALLPQANGKNAPEAPVEKSGPEADISPKLVDPPNPGQPRQRRPRPADLLGALVDATANLAAKPDEPAQKPSPLAAPIEVMLPFSLSEIEALIETAFSDPFIDVRLAARAARRMINGQYATDLITEEGILLSTIEKIIFLKEVPFFQSMTVDQLKVLANVCEVELFEEDTHIFNQGDPGGVLYVVVSGRVGIEQEKRKGSFVRLTTIEAHSYFGEMNLFDNSPLSATAIALQDTLTLGMRREPLIALARQHPDLSLELIKVLSQRLREANDRVAELTRTRTRELQKFFDNFD